MQDNSTEPLIEPGYPNGLRPINKVSLPPSSRCSSNDINGLLDHVYHTIDITHPDDYFKKRCVLAPCEDDVDEINDIMLKRFPGDLYEFGSEYGGQCYPEDQLPEGTAFLSLKMGCPVTVLHTGSRGVASKVHGDLFSIKMFSGQEVTVRRTAVSTIKGAVLLQFPVKLAFAMMIEEAKGESFNILGLDFRYPPISRYQLSLALSCAGIDSAGVKYIGHINMEERQTKKVNRKAVVCLT